MAVFSRLKTGWLAIALAVAGYLPIVVADEAEQSPVMQPEPYYVPHVEFGGYYFTDTPHKAGIARAFLPIGIDDPNHLLYIDARGIVKNGGVVREGNLGLGYRQLNAAGDKIRGVYGFFDRKRTSSGTLFSQLTFGLEYWHNHFFVGGNLYYPIGARSVTESLNNTNAALSQTSPGVFNVLVTTTNSSATEIALVGADFSLGYQFGENLIAYAGVYHFNSSTSNFSARAVQGPMLNLEYTFYPEMNIAFGLLDRITTETQLQYDSVRGTRWYAGLRFSIALGKHAPTGIRRRMVDPAFRDIDVVVSAQTTSSTTTAIATNAQGTTVQVNQVSSTADANALIGDPDVTVIAVNGTIADFNSGNATLADGQVLCGGTYEFIYEGKSLSVEVASAGEVQSVSGSDTLVKVAKNNSIQNITLTMVNPNNTAAGNIAIKADTATNELGILTVDKVTSNGAINISRTGAAQTGTVLVYGSNFTTPTTWDPTGLPSVGDFTVATSAVLRVDINNSTFKSVASSQIVVGLRFQSNSNGSKLTVVDINNSTIVGTDAGLVHNVGNGVAGTTSNITYEGGISNCNITGGDAGHLSEIGLLIAHFGNNNGTFLMNGAIKNNTISPTQEGIVVTDFNGSGTFLWDVTISKGITGNTINTTDATGISLNATRSSDTYNIVGINGNIITATTALQNIRLNSALVGSTINVSVGSGSTGLSAANNNAVVAVVGSGTVTVTPGL